MHHIARVRLGNYKSFIDETIELSNFSILVGCNNAGKSNLMLAIRWVLRGAALSINDFNDREKPVSVEAEINGIDQQILNSLGETHRPRIEPFIMNQMLKIKREQDQPGGVSRDARLQVWDFDENCWRANPTGLDAAIKAAFPEPIVVGAMENAAEDAGKFSKSTTIGRILSDILEPLRQTQAEEVASAFLALERILSFDGEQKATELRSLDNRIQPALDKFFPGLEAKVHIESPSLDSLIKGGTIKLSESDYDGASTKDVTTLGHGAQRSIQMALLKVLSEIKRDAGSAGSTTLLMIDEPELYLHPQAIESLRSSLRTLSTEGYQILMSTHSPQMITRQDAQDVILLRKSAARGSHARASLRTAVVDAIEQADHQSEVLFSLTNSSKFLFSEKIVLAEGKTEQRLLPELFQAATGCTLQEAKLALIDLGGAQNVPKAMLVMSAMDVDTKSVVDLDFVFRTAVDAGYLASNDSDLSSFKNRLKALANSHGFVLDAEGLPQSGNNFSAARIYEILAADNDARTSVEKLHDKLKIKNIWVWTSGTIEKHLGLRTKTSLEWSRLVVRLHNEPIEQVVTDSSVIDLCNWLMD